MLAYGINLIKIMLPCLSQYFHFRFVSFATKYLCRMWNVNLVLEPSCLDRKR